MARMIPEYTSHQLAQIESRAEQKVYEMLRDDLPAPYVVMHSVTWLASRPEHHAQDGEIDFLIIHPDRGYLTLEVKGGGIARDPRSGKWSSANASGTRGIKDPFAQARTAKHRILELVKAHRDWDRRPKEQQYLNAAHAVAFPDTDSGQAFIGPDRPAAITLCRDEWQAPQAAIEHAFACHDDGQAHALGADGMAIFERLFARPINVPALAIARIEEEDSQRIQLTQQQYLVLRFLGNRRRVGIQGGAGTGKTLIALEKARELARQGMRVLLLCYNRALGDHLTTVTQADDQIEATSFHKFCESRITGDPDYKAQALANHPGAKQQEVFTTIYPEALGYYLDDQNETVDAIIIDEAQDFHPDWWLPIQAMLADDSKSPFYLFYDLNQCLFQRPDEFPITEECEYALDQNCRNTAAIHQVVQAYYRGDAINPPDIEGVPVATHTAAGLDDQSEAIHALITKMIDRQKVPAEEIVVLVADRSALTKSQGALAATRLPKPATWSQDATPAANKVRVCSVAKFKGLEAAIVVLWGLDGLDPGKEEDRMDLYVGCSRPRSELHLVGGRRIVTRIAESGDEAE